MAVRVPNAEQVSASADEDPVCLAMALILVWEEHDPELAHSASKLASGNGRAVASAG